MLCLFAPCLGHLLLSYTCLHQSGFHIPYSAAFWRITNSVCVQACLILMYLECVLHRLSWYSVWWRWAKDSVAEGDSGITAQPGEAMVTSQGKFSQEHAVLKIARSVPCPISVFLSCHGVPGTGTCSDFDATHCVETAPKGLSPEDRRTEHWFRTFSFQNCAMSTLYLVPLFKQSANFRHLL